jgi:cytochrome c5
MRGGTVLLGLCVLLASLAARAEEPPELALTSRQGRLFAQACAHCHLRPGIGVPVLGVDADWAERRDRGFDSLLANSIDGLANMPPLGTCGACSEADFRALVSFLSRLADPGGTHEAGLAR